MSLSLISHLTVAEATVMLEKTFGSLTNNNLATIHVSNPFPPSKLGKIVRYNAEQNVDPTTSSTSLEDDENFAHGGRYLQLYFYLQESGHASLLSNRN